MSLDKIHQLASSLVKSAANNERLAIPLLLIKLNKHLQDFPQDQTLGSIAMVLGRMSKNQTAFIRRADLHSLYTKLHSRNTKFPDLFKEELGLTEIELVKSFQRDDSVKPIDTYAGADPVLANALQSAFDNQLPVKMYSQVLAERAQKSVGIILDAWGLNPTSLGVVEGNDKFLIVKADYETPKGITSFYVPVETSNDKLIEPSTFVGTKMGLQPLNHTNIKTYLTTHSGTKLTISASDVLNGLVKAASENREITDVEIAIIKLNAERKKHSEFAANQVIGQKIAEASVKEVNLPKHDEFVSFEKQFTSPAGLAAFQFGTDQIKVAREHLVRELVSFGYKNSQVVVSGHKDQTVFYSVSLDAGKIGFVIPVKIVNGKVIKPTMMICNGSPIAFTSEGINQLYVDNQTDFKAAAAASPMFELKPNELIATIKQAMLEENHSKAQDALNVLRSLGDEKVYALGFQEFLHGLKGKSAPQTSCSKPIKTAASSHLVCSHTGLPIHKVYQDKDGNCRPLYRQGADETYQGAYFMNAKIFG